MGAPAGGAGYDPVQLRSFLAVAETGSFTRAAARLGLGQPAVSQHVRKLEAATGRLLVARDTRTVALTPDGEAMTGFAQEIVAAHDRAAGYFRGERPHGRLRVGISDDLALTRLPQMLSSFRRDHPDVDLDLVVDQSGTLHRRLESDRLDLYVGKRPAGEGRGRLVSEERMVWVGTAGTRLDPARPVPLVMYPGDSMTRRAVQPALEAAGLGYRTACTCRGVNGLIAAVAAGIGVSAMARTLVPVQLVALGPAHRLPELGRVDLVLITNPRTQDRPASRALADAVLASGPATLTSP